MGGRLLTRATPLAAMVMGLALGNLEAPGRKIYFTATDIGASDC